VFNSVGIGLRQMVAPSVASGVNHFLNFAASVAILLISPTLVDYALANVAASLGGVVATMVGLRYVWRGWAVALPSRELTREVLGYSLKNQVSWAADLVNFQTDKIVIAVMIDARAAGAYEIGARVVLAAHAVSILTLSALIPTAAAEIETRGRAMIAGFYRHYTRLTVGISFPIQVLCCVAAPFILVAWLGEAPTNSATVLIVLSGAYLFKSVTGVASSVALADGRAGLVASNQVLMAGLNIAFTVSLAPLFGLWGVLGGTFAALTTGALLFMYRFHKVYEMPFSDFTEGVRGPLLLAVGLAVPFAIVDWIVSRSVDARPGAAVALIVVSALYSLIYWIAASRFGYLPGRLTLGRARRREPAAVATT
jgi:O-antigen/teichoic acid export membrane protein